MFHYLKCFKSVVLCASSNNGLFSAVVDYTDFQNTARKRNEKQIKVYDILRLGSDNVLNLGPFRWQ